MRRDARVMARHPVVGELDVAVAAAADEHARLPQLQLHEQAIVGIEVQSRHRPSSGMSRLFPPDNRISGRAHTPNG